jgi:nucleotide-binding universal stress UspA family protein
MKDTQSTASSTLGSDRSDSPDAGSSGWEGPILIGVGPEGRLSEGTLGFAVTSATQLGIGIELVHVVPHLVGGQTGASDVGIGQLVSQGQARLDEAVRRVRDRMSGAQPVHGRLLRGPVIDTLVDQSAFAQMVVLEHRDLPRWERWGSGSVTAGVAARAHAPVVSVPATWQPSDAPRPITVAVEDAPRAAAEIWTALGLAAVNDARVVVLRATYLAPAIEEMLRHEVDHEQMKVAARDELARDVNLPAEVCDRVPCTFSVRWGRPADVLLAATERSSLLVVARRDPAMPFGSHLGPVLRQVLREAKCPVLVVEPSPLPGAVPAAASATVGVG